MILSKFGTTRTTAARHDEVLLVAAVAALDERGYVKSLWLLVQQSGSFLAPRRRDFLGGGEVKKVALGLCPCQRNRNELEMSAWTMNGVLSII